MSWVRRIAALALMPVFATWVVGGVPARGATTASLTWAGPTHFGIEGDPLDETLTVTTPDVPLDGPTRVRIGIRYNIDDAFQPVVLLAQRVGSSYQTVDAQPQGSMGLAYFYLYPTSGYAPGSTVTEHLRIRASIGMYGGANAVFRSITELVKVDAQGNPKPGPPVASTERVLRLTAPTVSTQFPKTLRIDTASTFTVSYTNASDSTYSEINDGIAASLVIRPKTGHVHLRLAWSPSSSGFQALQWYSGPQGNGDYGLMPRFRMAPHQTRTFNLRITPTTPTSAQKNAEVLYGFIDPGLTGPDIGAAHRLTVAIAARSTGVAASATPVLPATGVPTWPALLGWVLLVAGSILTVWCRRRIRVSG
ncbi:MAG: hypothetical protein QOG53_677 [Frankiales bacterium]|jgi:hypothetical protein|nr:hypothetical protein [Frankiales bacterium]